MMAAVSGQRTEYGILQMTNGMQQVKYNMISMLEMGQTADLASIMEMRTELLECIRRWHL